MSLRQRKTKSELVQDRDGQWLILSAEGDRIQRIHTGQVDLALAEMDYEAWRRTGALSEAAQLWVSTARKMQNSASNRAAPFGEKITRLDILRKFMEQGYRCAVTGREFELHDTGRHQPWQPSIDRRDSTLGYQIDNVRITCLIVNMAMGQWGEAPLFELAGLLSG